jgi:hypothetical protein
VGSLSKGSSDLAKLEPHFRGTPVVESQTTRGFLRRSLEPHSGINTQQFQLRIYETNTSNQSKPAHRFSVNGLQFPSDRRPEVGLR